MQKAHQIINFITLKKIKILLILFTLIGAFLRLYNINGTLQFLGDQGRDALIVRSMLIDKDPVLIGPVTSVGNMYLGPGYYYFMLPFYALTYPSPMGPVYAVAFLGILTIPLIYMLGKELVGKKAALIATIIYSVTWTFIEQTRFSWNPNPAPIVSLVMIWAIYKAWTKSPNYWLLVGVMASLLLQLHYLTLLAIGAAGVAWLIAVIRPLDKKKLSFVKIIPPTIGAVGVFLLSLTPLVIFDFRHNFLNLRAFQSLLFGEEEHIRSARSFLDIVKETHGRSLQIFFEITIGHMRQLNTVLIMVVIGALIATFASKEWKKYRQGVLLLVLWVLIGIIGTSLYRSTVFDHYIAYLFPVTSLILGLCLAYLSTKQFGKIIASTLLFVFIIANVRDYRFQNLAWTITDIKNTSEFIESNLSPDEKYNVVLLAGHGDIEALNYRYFLTVSGHPPLRKEDWGQIDTLVVIDEDKKINRVADSPIYEIVVFPNKNDPEIIKIPDGPDVYFFRR